MGPKSEQKSISTLKAENQLNASRLAFSWFSGVKVGVKKRRQDRPRQTKTRQGRTRQDFSGFLKPSWAWKREQRQAETGQDRPRQAKTGQDRREERGEKREERGERREERERERGEVLRGGGRGLPAY